jgi:hypothetical protein
MFPVALYFLDGRRIFWKDAAFFGWPLYFLDDIGGTIPLAEADLTAGSQNQIRQTNGACAHHETLKPSN